MKRKALVLTAFLIFIFSILAIFGIAGASDHNNTSINDVVGKLVIALVILAVNVGIVNRFYVDGEWRV